MNCTIRLVASKAHHAHHTNWSIGDKSFSLVHGNPSLDQTCVPYPKVTIPGVPEPRSIAILGMGVLGFGILLRRKKSR